MSKVDTLTVELGERSYPIHIGPGLLQNNNLAEVCGNQLAIITNPTVNGLHGASLREHLPDVQVDVFEMADGEDFKSMATYGEVMDFLMQKRHNRTTTIVALGGGVVGDMAGFVAATFQRGVKFVQIPTTLLAQVDSSVGGKTAVNHPLGKNMIGAFYQPQLVLADTEVLSTLPAREYAAGVAEVIKYGVIADADFFQWLEANVDSILAQESSAVSYIVSRSCEIKADVVAEDEREAGRRAILNFGHTFGHALEQVTGYGHYLHGEAVAVGMIMASRFSEKLNLLPQGSTERLAELTAQFGLPTKVDTALDIGDVLDAMGMDKKVADGRIRFVVADRIGNAALTDQYPQEALNSTLEEYLA